MAKPSASALAPGTRPSAFPLRLLVEGVEPEVGPQRRSHEPHVSDVDDARVEQLDPVDPAAWAGRTERFECLRVSNSVHLHRWPRG